MNIYTTKLIMVESNLNDGHQLRVDEIKNLKDEGFIIDESRDFTTIPPSEFDKVNVKYFRLNFVGFTINEKNEIKTVFPKNYKWSEKIEIDRKKTFATIIKHVQKNPGMYIGAKFKKNLSTNYPFSAFFSIYDYYERYGIHFEEQNRLKPDGKGKVNWKETIRFSQKYINNGNFIMFPIYHNEKRRSDTFLAQCMIFAIDYTLDKFKSFIGKEPTNRPFPEFDFLGQKNFVLENLYSIKNNTYRDINIKLIDDLIDYFSTLESSGKYYLKHYSYSIIWEEMVMNYLKNYFVKFDNKQMVLSKEKLPIQKKFKKPPFYPNLANSNEFIQPDHYLEDGDSQIIMDAKYYEPSELNYKQISYLFFLKNRRDKINEPPKFSKTYSALIIPYNISVSKLHFEMDPLFNNEFADVFISEERLNINEVIDFWIKN